MHLNLLRWNLLIRGVCRFHDRFLKAPQKRCHLCQFVEFLAGNQFVLNQLVLDHVDDCDAHVGLHHDVVVADGKGNLLCDFTSFLPKYQLWRLHVLPEDVDDVRL